MRPMRAGEQNVSVIWANAVIDAMIEAGLRDVIVSPGARSTPLVAAVVDDPRIRDHSVIDERSAAFCALGLAQSTERPVALICTSGTAGANYFPAICEANVARLPIIVMTADRPPRLRESGASQAMRQVDLYGKHVRWSHDVAMPSLEPDELRYARAIARRAYAVARDEAGPVHLNFPFDKPLEPTGGRPSMASGPLVFDSQRGGVYQPVVRSPEPHAMTEVVRLLESANRPLIVVGSSRTAQRWARVLDEVARRIGAPILAEATSQLRFGPAAASVVPGDVIMSNREFAGTLRPDLVLRLGQPAIDWPVIRWLDSLDARRVIVAGHRDCDPDATADMIFVGDEGAFLDALRRRLPDSDVPSEWRRQFSELGDSADAYITRRFADVPLVDATVAYELAQNARSGAAIVLSASMPLRDFEAFAVRREQPLTIFCNRGLNGIDGVVSTAHGIAAGHDGPTTLLIGDVALAHDIGALQLSGRLGTALTVVVVDNGGGAIFDHLPVAGMEPMFARHFTTATDLHWEGAAALFGVSVTTVTSQQELREALQVAPDGGTHLIVARTDRAASKAFREDVLDNFGPG